MAKFNWKIDPSRRLAVEIKAVLYNAWYVEGVCVVQRREEGYSVRPWMDHDNYLLTLPTLKAAKLAAEVLFGG